MYYVVKGVLQQHAYQVILLNDNDTAFIKYFIKIGNECIRVVEIIEHRNRGYYFGLFLSKMFLKNLLIEISINERYSSPFYIAGKFLYRIETNSNERSVII